MSNTEERGAHNSAAGLTPLLVSISDAAKLLSISRGSFYRLMKRGELPYVRIGDRPLIAVDALKRFISVREDDLNFEGRRIRRNKRPAVKP